MFKLSSPIVDADPIRLSQGQHTAEIFAVRLNTTERGASVGVGFSAVDPQSKFSQSVWKNYDIETNPMIAKMSLKALCRNCGVDQAIIDDLFAGKEVDLPNALQGTQVVIDVKHNGDYTNVGKVTAVSDQEMLTDDMSALEHSGDDSIGQKQRKNLAVAKR